MVKKDTGTEGVNKYEMLLEGYEKRDALLQKAKRVLKFNDLSWEQTRQGLTKLYSSPQVEHELAAPGWLMHMQRLHTHSGKHVHQGGYLIIYILEGQGYSIFDGVRYDWKAGDMITLPFGPGRCEHQHFNEDPDRPSSWVAIGFHPWKELLGAFTRQVEFHPEWTEK